MMKINRTGMPPGRSKSFFCVFLVLLVLGAGRPLRAADLVTARYVRTGGQEVVVEVSVAEPPPSTLIVIQVLPNHVSIVRAQPAVKSMNSATGEVKWLFTDLKAGSRDIVLTLDRPLAVGDVTGEIRYRAPSGEMIATPIIK